MLRMDVYRKSVALLGAALVACSGGGGGGSTQAPVNPPTTPPTTLPVNPPTTPPVGPALALLAGSPNGPGTLDGTGFAARLTEPRQIAADRAGNYFVADPIQGLVRRISSAGVVTTIAGNPLVQETRDGPRDAAAFRSPSAIAIDAQGNLFVYDRLDYVIRRVAADGAVTTLAGKVGERASPFSMGPQYDGTGTAARFYFVKAIVVQTDGNLLVSDGSALRRVTVQGVVTTVSEGATAANQAIFASFDTFGAAIELQGDGSLLVADRFEVRRISPTGQASVVAGALGVPGYADATGAAARFGAMSAITHDAAGNILVTDYGNQVIRRISPTGVVSTLGTQGRFGGDPNSYSDAYFSPAAGLVVDSGGNIIASDPAADVVLRIAADRSIATFAGAELEAGASDGTGASARFKQLTSLAADASGALFAPDSLNLAVRRISPAGTVSTVVRESLSPLFGLRSVAVASSGLIFVSRSAQLLISGSDLQPSLYPFGFVDAVNGPKPVLNPSVTFADGLALDASGTLYVGAGNCPVRLSTGFYNADPLEKDCTGGFQRFSILNEMLPGIAWPINRPPSGMAIDRAGNLYATSNLAHVVAKITPQGAYSIIAGAEGVAGSVDGAGTQARFNRPRGIAVDDTGNLYVADAGNFTIRKITPAGVVSTIAGAVGQKGFLPGGLPARLDTPMGLAVVGSKLYVAMPYGVGVIEPRP